MITAIHRQLGPYTFVYLVFEQLKFGSLSTILSYWPLDVQHGISWQRTLRDLRIRIVALHKDVLGYKKFGNSLELSYSTVARVIQRFSKMGFTRNRPHKVDQRIDCVDCAMRQVQKLASKKQMHECCQHYFRGCRGSACQCSDHTPHTATSWFAWPSSQKEASSEAGLQKSLQTVCWRQPGQEHELLEHVLCCDESKVNLFDSDGVQCGDGLVRSTKKIVPCL